MDYKELLNLVQRTIASIPVNNDVRETISTLARRISTDFRKELGITGGRLYECRPDASFELIARFGDSPDGELGIVVPADYKPVVMTLENGIVVMEANDPGVDPVLEEKLGAGRFAAIAVGDENFILSFGVSPEISHEDLLFSLNIIRYVINQRIVSERYHTVLAEAQRIQQSILPQRIPSYAGFDIWGKTIPAEVVSGDFYDYIPISDSILGLAVADASGHGLPAALVVRDIHMGLRMGVHRDFKIVRTMQKLNNIIHRSRLTTKFVTLFYGELELNGTLIYTNAGHNPPFMLKKNNQIELLRHGGRVLGPTPDATYQRGYSNMEPGDILCLYSDGIVEAHDRQEREFGLERLQKIVKANRDRTAQEIGTEVLQKVEKFGRVGEDDRTVVIVKKVAPAEAGPPTP
jgi:sigma-B regulation protein RsbU (phosphoserine phosphatase)